VMLWLLMVLPLTTAAFLLDYGQNGELAGHFRYSPI